MYSQDEIYRRIRTLSFYLNDPLSRHILHHIMPLEAIQDSQHPQLTLEEHAQNLADVMHASEITVRLTNTDGTQSVTLENPNREETSSPSLPRRSEERIPIFPFIYRSDVDNIIDRLGSHIPNEDFTFHTSQVQHPEMDDRLFPVPNVPESPISNRNRSILDRLESDVLRATFSNIFLNILERMHSEAVEAGQDGKEEEQVPLSSEIKNRLEIKKCEEEGECSICQAEIKKDEESLSLSCKHCFHKNCIFPWFNISSKCPNCRTNIT
jgi:hypothetical protein